MILSLCLSLYIGALKQTGLENDRAVKFNVLANDTDVQSNFNLVYEDGTAVPVGSSRAPDDESYLDLECLALNVPFSRCLGYRYSMRRSLLRQSCIDNNQTVNASAGCIDPVTGDYSWQCLAVAYTSNALIPQCSPSADPEHCGIFLGGCGVNTS